MGFPQSEEEFNVGFAIKVDKLSQFTEDNPFRLVNMEYPIDKEGKSLMENDLAYILSESENKTRISKKISIPEYNYYPEELTIDSHLAAIKGRKEIIFNFPKRTQNSLEQKLDENQEDRKLRLEREEAESNFLLRDFENNFQYFNMGDKQIDSTIINLEVNSLVTYLIERIQDEHDEFKEVLKNKTDSIEKEHYLSLMKCSGALHDVGKAIIPFTTLAKPGKLSQKEYSQIQRHSRIGERFFYGADLLDMPQSVCLYHHERFDGNGYPNQIKGVNIPLTARFVSFIDVFDALYSKRTYKDAWDLDKIKSAILYNKDVDGRGSFEGHFDTKIIDYFKSSDNWNDFCNFVQSNVYKSKQ